MRLRIADDGRKTSHARLGDVAALALHVKGIESDSGSLSCDFELAALPKCSQYSPTNLLRFLIARRTLKQLRLSALEDVSRYLTGPPVKQLQMHDLSSIYSRAFDRKEEIDFEPLRQFLMKLRDELLIKDHSPESFDVSNVDWLLQSLEEVEPSQPATSGFDKRSLLTRTEQMLCSVHRYKMDKLLSVAIEQTVPDLPREGPKFCHPNVLLYFAAFLQDVQKSLWRAEGKSVDKSPADAIVSLIVHEFENKGATWLLSEMERVAKSLLELQPLQNLIDNIEEVELFPAVRAAAETKGEIPNFVELIKGRLKRTLPALQTFSNCDDELRSATKTTVDPTPFTATETLASSTNSVTDFDDDSVLPAKLEEHRSLKNLRAYLSTVALGCRKQGEALEEAAKYWRKEFRKAGIPDDCSPQTSSKEVPPSFSFIDKFQKVTLSVKTNTFAYCIQPPRTKVPPQYGSRLYRCVGDGIYEVSPL